MAAALVLFEWRESGASGCRGRRRGPSRRQATHPRMRPRRGWGGRRCGRGGASAGGACVTEDFLDGQQPAQVDEFEQAKLEVEALFLAIAKLVESVQHSLQDTDH